MRKQFFRLCKGPCDGRTISPGTPDYPLAACAASAKVGSFAVPSPTASHERADQEQAAAEVVHLYEPYERIDELSLEIVLCKYVGTRRLEPGRN